MFIELESNSGSPFYVRPEHVSGVHQYEDNDGSVVILEGGYQRILEEDAEDVIKKVEQAEIQGESYIVPLPGDEEGDE